MGAAGVCTVAVACPIGTGHCGPMAFQYTSTWSLNWFIAPRTS